MRIEDLDQVQGYDHIYLSPHLDDAALSCGGGIAAQRAAGERALVVTLCTAAPAPDMQFSDLALEFHRKWGLAPAEVDLFHRARTELARACHWNIADPHDRC